MIYEVEGCGADKFVRANSTEHAAQLVAGPVTLVWTGTGSDRTSLADYQIEEIGYGINGRITVREVTMVQASALSLDDDEIVEAAAWRTR